MKPVRKIKRVSDARRTQGRVIFHMACSHNVIRTADEVVEPWPTTEMECDHCPDVPPDPPKELDPLEAFYRASSGETE